MDWKNIKIRGKFTGITKFHILFIYKKWWVSTIFWLKESTLIDF